MTRKQPFPESSRRDGRHRVTRGMLATALVFASTVVDLGSSIPQASAAPLCASPPFTGSTTVSGVVNTYYPGTTATVVAGQANITITVGTPTGAATPLAVGDLVAVMQMQGAEVDASNTGAYGDGVGGDPGTGYLANSNFLAGQYEYATVRSVSGALVGLNGAGANGGLLNGYRNANATAAAGQFRYQLIRVPQYSGAVLSAATPPTAPAWNGATGGVVALDASSTLNLNGSTINVTGLGFRGGLQRVRGGSGGLANTDYRTPTASAANGQKGEGIAGRPVWQTGNPDSVGDGYPNGDFGRGAPGNAGGGGTDGNPSANDQNSGGGGGGNGGTGGRGGNTWSSNLPRGGFGGAVVPGSVSRVFLGGGGGAGSDNNNVLSSSGGAGGGMVLVRAASLTGAGTVTANGVNGATSGQDGAGGAGAGGSVVVLTAVTGAASGLGGLTVNAVGGRGGDETHPSAHGPGGGGGGGRVITSATPAAVDVAGGANGTHAVGAYGATPGTAGTATTALIGASPGANTGSLCLDVTVSKSIAPTPVVPGQTVTFTVTVTNRGPYPALGTAPITVTDTIPASISSPTWTCSASAGSSCGAASGSGSLSTTADLSVGGTATYTISGVLVPTFTGTLSNTASAAGPSSVPELNSADNSATVTATAVPPVLISKSSDATGPLVDGDVITYSIDIENPRSTAIADVEVTDVLPPGLVYEAASTVVVYPTTTQTQTTLFTDTFASGVAPWNSDDNGDPNDVDIQTDLGSQRLHLQDNNVGAWRSVPDLSPYDDVDLSFDFRRVSWENTEQVDVFVRADATGESTTNANCDTDPAWVLLGSITRVQATDSGYQPVTYVIPAAYRTATAGICIFTNSAMGGGDDFYVDDVTMIGRAAATTTITLDNDPGTAVPPLADGTPDPGFLVAPADAISLRAGATMTVTYRARVDVSQLPPGATSVTNGATFDAPGYPGSETASVIDDLAVADLSLVKTDDGPVVAGDQVTYTITVSNAGPQDALGVVVNDTPDDNVAVTSITASQGGCSAFPCSLGSIANGASATVTVIGTVGPGAPIVGTLEADANEPGIGDCIGADICNVASVTSGSIDWVSANNADDEPTDVVAPLVELAKSAAAPVDNGDGTYDVVYTVTVSNGGTAAGSYDLDDTLTAAAGVTPTVIAAPAYDSGASTDSTTETPGSLPTIVTGGSVDPGAQDVFTYTVQFAATPALLATLDSCSTVGGDHAVENTATTSTGATAGACVDLPALVVDKPAPVNDDADGSGDVSVGDTLTYTITATNSGTANLTNVTVVDDLTGDSTTCAGPVAPGGTCVLVATYVVQPGDLGGDIVNTATGDSDQTGPVTEGETASVPAPTLVVDKPAPANADEDGSGDVSVGDTLTYTITATNSGTANLTNVTVVDDLTGDSITCAGPVAPAATCVLVATYVVQAGDVGGDIVNTATADSDQTGPVTDGETVSVPTPTFVVDKPAPVNDDADGSGDVSAGDTLTYTITATNTGASVLTNVTIVDDLTGDSTSCGVVLPGGTCVLVATYVVEPGDLGGDIVNTATGDSDQTGPVTEGETVSVPTPMLVVDKPAPANADEDGGGDVSVGDTLTYTITATNTGTANLTNVTVVDDLTGDSTSCGVVLPGGTCVLVATYVVEPGDLGGDIVNTATADSDQTGPVTDGETVVVPAPMLVVDKPAPANADEDGGGDVSVGDTLTYTITATNTGTANLTNVTVVDDLTGDSITCAGPVAPAGTCVLVATYVVQAGDVGGDIVNTATADSDQTGPVTEGETVSVPAPMLVVDKPAPANADEDGGGDVSVGDTLTYTITATNTGTANLTNVTVVDDLTGDSITCAGPVAPAGTCVLVTAYVVQQPDVDAGRIDNEATADSDQTGPVTDTEAVLIARTPELRAIKVDGAPTDIDLNGVDQGDEIVYTITVTNTGNVTITGVDVSDSLIATVTGGPVDLAPGDAAVFTGTYVLTQDDLDDGVVVNQATASGLGPGATTITDLSDDPDDATDADTEGDGEPDDPTVTLLPQDPILALAKAGGPAFRAVGDVVTYGYTLSNDGNVTLSPTFSVSDDKTTVDCSAAVEIAPGESTTCTATYVVVQADIDAGQVTNVASATASDPGGDPITSDDATETVLADLRADVEIVKTITDGSTSHVPGTPLSYTLTVTNNGPSVTTTTTVTDTLPPDAAYLSGTPSNGSTCGEAAGVVACDLGSLAIGETVTIDIVVDVDPGSTAALTNNVTVASDLPDDAPGNNVSSISTSAAPAADLSIDKIAPAIYVPGLPITYQLVVTNAGPSTATAVEAIDTLPSGVTFDAGSSDAACVEAAGTVTCGQVDLAPGDSATFAIVVDTPSSASVTSTNTSIVTSAVPDPDLTNNRDTESSDPTPLTNLVVDKSGPIAPVAAGEQFDFTITVRNEGPSDALEVAVADTLPAGLTAVSSNVVGGAGTEACTSAVSCDLGTVVAGITETITIRVQVAPDVTGAITNIATATTSTPGDVVADSTDDHVVDVVEATDVAIAKSDDVDPVQAGGVVTYTLEVVNSGPSQATGVSITDPLPTGTTFVSAPGCTETTGTVTCDIAVLPVGLPASFDVTVIVNSDVPDGTTLINTATVATASDTNAANDTASEDTTVIATADLAVDKTSTPDPFVPGQPMTYTISVVNLGPSDARSVVLTDALPAGFTPISTTPTPTCGLTGSDLTCNLATLAAGDDLIVTVNGVASSSATSLTNTAIVTSATSDPVPTNDTDTDVNTGSPLADLSVVKTDSVDPVAAGADLTYTITVTNNGPSDAADVTVTDSVPAGYTVTSVDRAECDTSVSCTFAVLAAGASETIVIGGTVGSDVADTRGAPELSNTVDVSSSTPDPVAGNDTDTETTDVVEIADLALTKVEPIDPIVPGGTREYTIRVANTGPSDADDVVVTDTLPPGLTFSSAGGATCTAADPIITCDLGTVSAGAVIVITITADVDPSVTGVVTNAAEVTSSTPDPDPSDNADTSDSTTSPDANLSVGKIDLADPIRAGTALGYQISGRNAGPSTAVAVIVTDTLPAGSTFVDATFTTGTGTCSESLGVLTCSLGTLLPGAIFAVDVQVDVDPSVADGSILTNSVSITSPTPDSDLADNSDTEDTTVVGLADVGVTKVADFPEATPGENVEYTIVVSNAGPSDALDVSITDTLPAGLLNVVVTGAICTTGNPFTCDIGTMAPGASVSVTVAADIDPATAGSLVNSVTATTSTVDPNPDNDTATTAIPLVPVADLSIVKSGPATAVAGTTLTYTVIVTNGGPSDAQNVEIADTLPPGTSLISATVGAGAGSCTGTTCTFPLVPAGTAASISYLVAVDSSVADGSTLSNTATVTSDTPDPDTSDNTDGHTTTVEAVADLSVVKSVSVDPFAPGESITYTIVVQNAGPSDAVDVVMSDPVPAGLTVASASATAGTCSVGAAISCDLGTLVDGGTVTITIVADTDPSLRSPVSNTAEVTTSTTDPDPTDDTSTATTDPAPVADLQILKSAGLAAIAAGEELTYRVELTNLGSSTALAVELVDVLPAELSYVSHVRTSAGGACVFEPLASTIRCTTPALLPGDTISVDITVQVSATVPDGDSVSNTAVANSATTDPVPGNDTSTVTTPVVAVSDLSLTKALTSGPLVPGTSEQYEIVVTNAGPSDAVDVVVSDTVPAGLTITGVLASSGSCTDDGTILSCDIGSIAVGASVTIIVSVDVAADVDADVINTAITSGSNFDPTPDDNTATATDPVVPTADLVVVKSTGTAVVVPGTAITYVIAVSNAGPSDATNAAVTDTLPAGLVVTSATATQGTCVASGSSVDCDLGTLAAGAAASITIVADVAPRQVAPLTNTATVTSDADDPDTSNNTSSVTDVVAPSADVSISKSAASGPFVPGQPVTYTLVVANAGPSSARSVVVTDTVPAGVTPVSATADVGTCSITGSTVTCTLGVLDPLDEMTITLRVDTAPRLTGTIVNAAAVAAATADPDRSNNADSSSIRARPTADVRIVKAAPALASGGSSITYELTVTNSGPSVATDVTITDDLPAATTFDSASGACAEEADVVACDLGDLAPGASVTVAIVVLLDEVAGSETVVNTATVSTTATDPNAANDTSTADTLVSATPGVLTGTIWIDTDRDGVRDRGEAGVAGVTVIITGDPDGDGVLDTFRVVTGADGAYAIALPPGTWTVTTDPATLPFGTAPTTATIGPAVIEPNGSADVSFGRTYGSIRGRVWFDVDGDGVVDPGESDLRGVTVRVRCPGLDGVLGNGDDITAVGVTDGPYEITGLPVGQTCSVTVDTTNLPPSLSQTFDPDGRLDGATVLVVVGTGNTGVNFGYRTTNTVPSTGSDVREIIRISAFLLAAGAALLLASRRRRIRLRR